MSESVGAPFGSDPQSTTTQEAVQTRQANSSGGDGSGEATFGSLQELRTKEPKLFQVMIESCMQRFCQQQERHNKRFKQIMRDNGR